MSVENGNGGVSLQMPVAPAYPAGFGGGYNNGGLFGGYGGDWIILFLFAMMFGGGWGMGGFGGFGGGFGGMYEFPWLLTGQQNINANTNNGFRDQMINDNVTSVRDGIAGLSTQLCGCYGDMQMSLANGFAGVNQNISSGTAAIQNSLCNGFAGTTAAITGAQNAIAQQLYADQIADLNRSYAAQTAVTAGQTAIQAQLAQNGYNQATSTADIKYTIATENCADRATISNGVRDIIASNTAQTQAILDKLCALELDGYKRENDQLRTQLNMANLAASQTAQTAELRQSGATQLNQLVSELRSCPIPAMPVAGNTPLFSCNPGFNNSNGCGCGCGSF